MPELTAPGRVSRFFWLACIFEAALLPVAAMIAYFTGQRRCCITRRQCVGASPPLISGRSVRWNPFRLGESERSQSVECLTLDQGLDLLILEPARRELDP